MSFHLEVLSKEFQRRLQRNPRYSLRSYAKALGLHPSALSRILAGKQLLSTQASAAVAANLQLPDDEKRLFLTSVVDAHRLQDMEKLGQSVRQPGLRQERVEAPAGARPMIERIFCAALMELTLTTDFRWDAEWIAGRLDLSLGEAREMMQALLTSGMLEWRDGKVAKVHRDTTSVGPLSEESRRAGQEEVLRLTERSLRTHSRTQHTQLTLIAATDPSKLEEARRRFFIFMNEMGDLLQTGERTEVYALGLQFFPLTMKGNGTPA